MKFDSLIVSYVWIVIINQRKNKCNCHCTRYKSQPVVLVYEFFKVLVKMMFIM
jgi:hypothetical protein